MKLEKDFFFLLGGHDLEMIEIKTILTEYKNSKHPEFQVDYFDNNLEWGARLSSYSYSIPGLKSKTIVGLELTEDITPPANYFSIDHHGERADSLSSLEQVAALLHIQLNRFQMLIAINDRNYIPGLLSFGATKKEVDEIRINDRKAQGVTEEDENHAVDSINNHLELIQNIITVKSSTSKFSTITDRLFPFERLLIYNDDILTYYGQYAVKLPNAFPTLINEKKAYFGGGMNGFFGIGRNEVSKAELNQIKERIYSIINNELNTP